MDLRARQRAATRAQILEAVHGVLADESPATLSMPRVAARAGVGLRTLYRYFPTKEALVDAAAEQFRVPAAAVGGAITVDTLPDYLAEAWTGFTERIGAIRSQHLAPAGRALRDARLPRSRTEVRRALEQHDLGLPDDELDRLVDLVVAVISSSMYLELVDRLGHADADAARLAAWAVRAVVERAAADGGIKT